MSDFSFEGRLHFIQDCCLIQCWPFALCPCVCPLSGHAVWSFIYEDDHLVGPGCHGQEDGDLLIDASPFRCSHFAAMPYWHKDNKMVWLSVLSGCFISCNNHASLRQEEAHHAALIAEIKLNIRNRNSYSFIHLLNPVSQGCSCYALQEPSRLLINWSRNVDYLILQWYPMQIILTAPDPAAAQAFVHIHLIHSTQEPAPGSQLRLHGVIFMHHRDAVADECQQYTRGRSRARRAPLLHQITIMSCSTRLHLVLTRSASLLFSFNESAEMMLYCLMLHLIVCLWLVWL